MKPRLEPVPWTLEDAVIWGNIVNRWCARYGAELEDLEKLHRTLQADRRDARIMYLCGRAIGNNRPPEVQWLILCCAAYWNEVPWWDRASTEAAARDGLLGDITYCA